MPLMPGVADLTERVNQGVLAMGLLEMKRSIVVLAGGGPRLSQLAGTVPHACFTHMTRQIGAGPVARLTRSEAETAETTESQM